MDDDVNYHHSSMTPESNNDCNEGHQIRHKANSPTSFTPNAYDETYASPIPKSKEDDSTYIDPRDLDKRTKRYHLSDPKEPACTYKDDYVPEAYHAYSNSQNSNLRNHKTRTIYTICETNNEAGSSVENLSSNLLRVKGSQSNECHQVG